MESKKKCIWASDAEKWIQMKIKEKSLKPVYDANHQLYEYVILCNQILALETYDWEKVDFIREMNAWLHPWFVDKNTPEEEAIAKALYEK